MAESTDQVDPSIYADEPSVLAEGLHFFELSRVADDNSFTFTNIHTSVTYSFVI